MERETQEDAGFRGSVLALVPVHLHLEALFKEAGYTLHRRESLRTAFLTVALARQNTAKACSILSE